MQGDRCSEVLNYGSMLSLLPTVILVAFVDTSGTPKHVSAEDVELFRQACHISRQVFGLWIWISTCISSDCFCH